MIRVLFISLGVALSALSLSNPATAQDLPAPDALPTPVPDSTIVPDDAPNVELTPTKPDYSKLSPSAERELRLNSLFDRLGAEDDSGTANLIAEEIWALWLDSGSASVNLVLRRGSDAQAKGDMKLARLMYDHTTSLSPDFAEGWARSARLALEEKNLSRALNESIRALAIEPRHFYALWTMGNVFEQLGRTEEALEAYREANTLYPELAAVKERREALESDVDGTVL